MMKKIIKYIDCWFDKEHFLDINGYNNIQTNNYTLLLITLSIIVIMMIIFK